MGNRKANRREFFAKHPYCCFCGGSVPTATEDHLPARSLFLGRHWPVGYVFPACEACNNGAAEDELFMAFLVRLLLRAPTEEEREELRKAVQGIRARYPEFLSGIQRMPRVQARKLQRQIDPASAVAFHVPPKALEVANRYGQKLGKALHYMHTGEILPATGESWAYVMPNSVDPRQQVPADLMGPLALAPKAVLQRANVDLSAQFSYSYTIVDAGAACCFLVTFNDAVSILIVTFRSRADAPDVSEREQQASSLNKSG